MTLFSIILVAIFSTYCFFESMSALARYSGFKIGALSMGVALQNQLLSLNRFIGFLIAPMIGFYADTIGSGIGIAAIGLTGSLIGACSLLIGYWKWNAISSMFASIGQSFLNNGYGLKSLGQSFYGWVLVKSPSQLIFKRNYFWAQFVTTGFAMPAVFAVNIIALSYDEYSATVLQLSSVISGLGNLLLNFYTYPNLAVVENVEPEEADGCYKSIYIGKIAGLGIMAPAVILLSFLV